MGRSVALGFVELVAVVSCGVAPPLPPAPASPPPASAPAEPAACVTGRNALVAELERSRALPCAGDDACVVITGPWTFSHEDDVVANVADARDLDRRTRAFLDRCGRRAEPPSATYYRMVAARCDGGRCGEVSYDMHPDLL